jgi:HK97 family phage major capsid protein
MNELELKALIERVGEDASKVIASKMAEAQTALDVKLEISSKSNATKAEIEASEVKFQETLKSTNDSLIAIMKEQGAEIAMLKNGNLTPKSNISFKEALKNSIESKSEEIGDILKNGGKQSSPLVFNVDKAAVTMGEGTTIGSGSTQVTLTGNTGIISSIRRREERYLQSVSVGTINSARALWIEETDEQGTPIFVAEGASKVQLSSLWVEKTAPVQKIAVYGKVTTELMADLPQLLSYIQSSLMKRLSVKLETELFTGAGTGNTISGAKTLATTFSAGANALAIDNANEFDVLDALALQVEVANGVANAVYIHPSTWAKMKGLKDSTSRPIWKDYIDPTTGVVNYAGMNIFTSTAITAGEFVGGDMEVLHVLYRDNLTVQIGLDGNDFTNNVKTIIVEQRLVQFASANDTPCLVKGVFSTAKAALETA